MQLPKKPRSVQKSRGNGQTVRPLLLRWLLPPKGKGNHASALKLLPQKKADQNADSQKSAPPQATVQQAQKDFRYPKRIPSPGGKRIMDALIEDGYYVQDANGKWKCPKFNWQSEQKRMRCGMDCPIAIQQAKVIEEAKKRYAKRVQEQEEQAFKEKQAEQELQGNSQKTPEVAAHKSNASSSSNLQ
jgi:hypothetical protein